jgi:hypothetical protein
VVRRDAPRHGGHEQDRGEQPGPGIDGAVTRPSSLYFDEWATREQDEHDRQRAAAQRPQPFDARARRRVQGLPIGRLIGTAARELHRVPGLVPRDLRVSLGDKVDPADVGEPHQVNQHVSCLIAQTPAERLVEQVRLSLCIGQPLQLRGQLTDFTRQRHRQVLGRVEPLPVPRLREGTQTGGQLLQVAHPREGTDPTSKSASAVATAIRGSRDQGPGGCDGD